MPVSFLFFGRFSLLLIWGISSISFGQIITFDLVRATCTASYQNRVIALRSLVKNLAPADAVFDEQDEYMLRELLPCLNKMTKSIYENSELEQAAQTVNALTRQIMAKMLAGDSLFDLKVVAQIISKSQLTDLNLGSELRRLVTLDPLPQPYFPILELMQALAKVDMQNARTQRIFVQRLAAKYPPAVQRLAFQVLKKCPYLDPSVWDELVAMAIEVRKQDRDQAARWNTFPVRLLVKHGVNHPQGLSRLRQTITAATTSKYQINDPRMELQWALFYLEELSPCTLEFFDKSELG